MPARIVPWLLAGIVWWSCSDCAARRAGPGDTPSTVVSYQPSLVNDGSPNSTGLLVDGRPPQGHHVSIDVMQQARLAVVQVRAIRNGSSNTSHDDRAGASTLGRFRGSGFIMAPQGIVVTAEHVVRNATRAIVVLQDGTEHQADRIVVAPSLDLALLKITTHPLPYLELVEELTSCGSAVVALGGQSATQPTSDRSGIVIDLGVSLQGRLDPAGRRDYRSLIESSTRLDVGFSGGPLIDSAGRVVGIQVAAIGRGEGTRFRGYAVPMNINTKKALARLLVRLNEHR